MIIKITAIWTRKTTEVDFWKAPAELIALNEPLLASGDLSMSWSVSDDGLTLTQLSTFASEEVEIQVTTDPTRIAFRAARDVYNTENGIDLISNNRVEFKVNK